MTPEQHTLVIQFALGRLSYLEFVKQFGLDPIAEEHFVARALNDALDTTGADDVDCVLLLAFHLDLMQPALAPILARLLLEPWHQKHEDIALVLQDMRDPNTVDALAQAAQVKHAYLEYDDSHALARKCTWALADIGTEAARNQLERLASNADPEIAVSARKRLENWDRELSRKGGRRRRAAQ